MIDRAIEKIQAAIDESKDPMQQVLGQQIIDNITTNARARMILEEGKTLPGCKKEMDKFAAANKKGNQSVVSPKQAEEVIFKYFGFDNAATSEKKPAGIVNILDFM